MSLNIQNKIKVDLQFGELKSILKWCENNCIGEWHYLQIEPAGRGKGEYEFYFEEEKDWIAFTIWKT